MTTSWNFGWESVSALATVAAVVVALGIALGDTWVRWRTRKAKRKLQWVLLWPVMHHCRGAFFNVSMNPLLHIDAEATPDLRSFLTHSAKQLRDAAISSQELTEYLERQTAHQVAAVAAIALQVAGFLDTIEARPAYLRSMYVIGVKDRIKAECKRGQALADELCEASEVHVAKAAGTGIYSYEDNAEGEATGYGLGNGLPNPLEASRARRAKDGQKTV